MSEFSKQDWQLINDLINICWQAGAVKAPQMGQALEQLRGKVLTKLGPLPKEKEVKK